MSDYTLGVTSIIFSKITEDFGFYHPSGLNSDSFRFGDDDNAIYYSVRATDSVCLFFEKVESSLKTIVIEVSSAAGLRYFILSKNKFFKVIENQDFKAHFNLVPMSWVEVLAIGVTIAGLSELNLSDFSMADDAASERMADILELLE